jgi:hypothetical protein
MKVQITSTKTSSISVYFECDAHDGNPNQFKYDLKYTKIKANKTLTLNANSLPMCVEENGFVGLIEVHGFDIANDEALENNINIKSNMGSGGIEPRFI